MRDSNLKLLSKELVASSYRGITEKFLYDFSIAHINNPNYLEWSNLRSWMS
jgi:hypothetical protein